MDEQFKQFVRDVQQIYTYSDSRIDKDYNIIVEIEGRSFLVSCDNIMTYYNAFKNTSVPYQEWLTRTVGHITQLVEKWYKRWH